MAAKLLQLHNEYIIIFRIFRIYFDLPVCAASWLNSCDLVKTYRLKIKNNLRKIILKSKVVSLQNFRANDQIHFLHLNYSRR